jgi:alanine racemase
LELSGIFTHLSSADSDKAYTHHQIETFNSAIKIIEKFGFKPKLIHAANSSASILYKQAHYSALRPGIALYGLLPFKGADKLINIKPVLSWKTKLILIKTLPKGSAISYGQTFVTKRKTKLGVISVGYADGYSRLLSNKGYVLVKGKKVPILGRVTMDLTMIDLTDVHNAKVGDEVVLIGSQGKEKITAEELAELTQTINYEVVCRVHPRVKRIYIDD